MIRSLCLLGVAFVLIAAAPPPNAAPGMIQTGSDIPAKWDKPQPGYDYTKREVMIPMRDGVKLHTVIMVPKDAHGLPMQLERTPYDASSFTKTESPFLRDTVWSANREWVDGGYIFVYQDIRGKYGSERLCCITPYEGKELII